MAAGDELYGFELFEDLVTILRSGLGRSLSLFSPGYSCCECGGEILKVNFFFGGSSITGEIESI